MTAGPELANEAVAAQLEEVAELLEAQHANPYRVRCYRAAARTVLALGRDLRELLADQGRPGLRSLPGIGESLSRSIEELATTGHLALLSRLRGDVKREDVLTTVPTIGPGLARRIHDELGIESLVELEAAAHDGRLERVPGFGRRRLLAVRESLAARLRPHERRHRPAPPPREDDPDVAELLDVDAEYLRRVRADALPRIAPRRFNPGHEAWLPILHTGRGPRHYTALFSNTARAHELGTTHDWVVIYRDDQGGHGQWTVVTARFGDLTGLRIVRGRESACRAHYDGLDRSEGPTGTRRSAAESPSG